MPQPFPKKLSPPQVRIGEAVDDRPGLALLAMKLISDWSKAESMLSNVFVSLLGANPGPAAAIYMSLRSNNVQKDAFRAVVEDMLPDEDAALFFRAFELYEACAKTRNRLAHHLWATDARLPNHLILVEPRGANKVNLLAAELRDAGLHAFDDEEKSKAAVHAIHDLHSRSCMTWALADFVAANNKSNLLFKVLVTFRILIGTDPNEEQRNILRAQLSQLLESA